MQKDMHSGWGIRTLASSEHSYNPIDYQVGAVWPHDNSLIGLGLHRAGLLAEFEKVFTGVFDAATLLPMLRLPEVLDGFARSDYPRPVLYPVSCSPQAWAAGTLPLLLSAALGLAPDAAAERLLVRCPHLPAWLERVDVHGLRVGSHGVDLSYRRVDGHTECTVTANDGLAVSIETN
jgi:glycogen debranching enzyme